MAATQPRALTIHHHHLPRHLVLIMFTVAPAATCTLASTHTTAALAPSETSALRDCASTVSAAASLTRQSSAELTKLEQDASRTTLSFAARAGIGMSSSSRQAGWEVSNAKTWLGAAMANEGTCADGLVEAGAVASSAGKEVTAVVATVKQYTSNALALVNGIPV